MATSGKTIGKSLQFTLDLTGGATPTDISSYVRSVTGLPGEKDLADVTAGGATGYSYIPGLQKCDFSIEFVFDDTSATSAYNIVKNFMADTTTRSFVFGPAGSTTGYAKISGECWLKKLSLPAKVTDALICTLDCTVDGAITIGVY
jgi:hypothetical protein